MKFKFWGTRGSIPIPGEKTIKYGGNTTCMLVTGDCLVHKSNCGQDNHL